MPDSTGGSSLSCATCAATDDPRSHVSLLRSGCKKEIALPGSSWLRRAGAGRFLIAHGAAQTEIPIPKQERSRALAGWGDRGVRPVSPSRPADIASSTELPRLPEGDAPGSQSRGHASPTHMACTQPWFNVARSAPGRTRTARRIGSGSVHGDPVPVALDLGPVPAIPGEVSAAWEQREHGAKAVGWGRHQRMGHKEHDSSAPSAPVCLERRRSQQAMARRRSRPSDVMEPIHGACWVRWG